MKKILFAMMALLVVAGLALSIAMPALAADTGWMNPTANAVDSNGGFDTNPANAYTDGSGNASDSVSSYTTDNHRYYNYNLGVPAGATINGIEVRIDWWLNGNTGTNTIGVQLSWDGGTSWTSAKTDTTEPTSEKTTIFGNTSDDWGHSWSANELGNTSFRVRVQCSATSSARTFYLDWIPVRVTYTPDTTPPTVTINQAAAQGDPTNESAIDFTVVFSESVSDFATGDVTVSGTAGGTKTATVTGSGTTYNVAVTGMTSSGTVTATIAAGVAHDAAGNPNAASTSSDNTVTYDNIVPTVTINQAAGQADPTNTSPIKFTVVFSESVSDFATGDVTLSGTAGATTGTVTGSGTTYNVAVTGMTGNGTVIATITAGKAHDAAGNANTASTSSDNTVTYAGWKAPTCTSTPAGAIAFGNPERAYTSNDSRATATSTDDKQMYGCFGLSIPTGATIVGIEVSLEANDGGGTRTVDVSLSWNGNATFTSGTAGIKNAGDFGSSDTTRSVGGTADTWGRTWSPSDFSDANFKVLLDATLATGTFSLDYLQVNVYYTPDTAPVAVNDSYSTNEDTTLNVAAPGVLGNDTDAEANPFTAVKVSDPSHGTVTLNANGNFTYIPTANYNGPDSFTYKANDGYLDSNIATVSITVNAVNDAPAAVADSYSTNEDTTLNVAAPGVLGNDTDAEANPLTAVKVSDPSHGTVTLNANGNFTYIPTANYNGPDSFTYKANDGYLDSNVATVSITVTAVNDAPSFTKGGNESVLEDAGAQTVPSWATSISAGPSDESGQTPNFIIDSNDNPGLFSAGPAIAPNGTLTYTPAPNANGIALIGVKVHDNGGTANGGVDTSSPQTFTITVTAVNDVPSFTKGSNESVLEDAGAQTVPSWATSISAGPSNESAQTLDFIIDSNDNPGLFSAGPAIAPNGTLTYTPAPNANGIALIGVKVHDNGGTANGGVDTSSPQTFTITVTAVNDAPVANDQLVTTNEDTAKAITLIAADVDGDTLSYIIVDAPAHGNLTGTAPDVTYTPSLNYNGSDSFTFKANDGTVDSNEATVSITINPVDDPPVANDKSVSTDEDTALPITLTATEVDGDPLTFTIVTPPGHGNLTGTAPHVTYTPALNYNGPDSFTFKVNDGICSSFVTRDLPDYVLPGDAFDVTITFSAPDSVFNAIALSDTADGSYMTVSGNGNASWCTPAANVANPVTNTAQYIWFGPLYVGYPVGTSFTAVYHVTVDPGTPLGIYSFSGTLQYYIGSTYHTVSICGDNTIIVGNSGGGGSNIGNVSITVNPVNDAPVVSDIPDQTIAEGSIFATISLDDYVSDVDNTDAEMTWTYSGNSSLTVTIDGSRVATIGIPDVDWNGAETITFKATDPGALFDDDGATFTVTAVNDVPSFTKGADQNVLEDAGAQTVSGWATAISAGPSDESGQALDFIVTNDNNSLFSAQPAIAADGNLTYTPADNANGSAIVTVQIHDDGGTANGGNDTSAAQTFNISVTAVNDVPSFTKGADQNVLEDAGAQTVSGWATAISAGPSDESGQALDFIVTNDNNSLFSAQPAIAADGNLTYTPADNANGSAIVTVQIHDDGGTANGGNDTSASQTFNISVTAVNDVPVADDQSVGTNEDTAKAITLTATDVDLDLLTYSIVTPPAHGNLTGTAPNVTYTPDLNYNGLDYFTFKAFDGAVDSNIGNVSITITEVNNAPVVSDIPDQTIAEGATFATISLDNYVSDIDNSDAEMTWTYSGNSSLTVTIDGSRVATIGIPDVDWNGAETITFKATDPGALFDDDGATFTVTAVNDAPVLTNPGNQTVDEETLLSFTLLASDPDVPANTLTYSISSGSESGMSLDASTGAFSWTPTEAQGLADYNVTFRVTDDGTPNLYDEKTIKITVYVNWDINRDGCINISDLVSVGGRWMETGAPGWIPEDVNSDGVVNISDLVIIGGHWMEGCF